MTVSGEQRTGSEVPVGTSAFMLNETLKRFFKNRRDKICLTFEKGSLLHLVENFPNGAKTETEDVTMIQVRANEEVAVEVVREGYESRMTQLLLA